MDHLADFASGVPNIENGTGVAQTTTVVGILTDWGLGDLITATATPFDTTRHK